MTIEGKPWICPATDGGDHIWTAIQFVMELGNRPHPDEGRLFAVCMPCQAHTYLITKWVGYCIAGEES